MKSWIPFQAQRIEFPALQCRLECESGYVAQRTPLITCVNGEYAQGCHYLQQISQNLHTWDCIFKKRSQRVCHMLRTWSSGLPDFHLEGNISVSLPQLYIDIFNYQAKVTWTSWEWDHVKALSSIMTPFLWTLQAVQLCLPAGRSLDHYKGRRGWSLLPKMFDGRYNLS